MKIQMLTRRSPKSEAGLVCRSQGEGGFTLVEFLISSLIMTIVLSSAVGLATSIQNAYGQQYDENVAEQEARYALDWIARDLRSAGSDPYWAILADQEIVIDPNGGVDNDDSIRIQADALPDGPDGDNTDPGEIITIALEGAGDLKSITRQDVNAGDVAGVAMTEPIFTDLEFTWLASDKTETAVSDNVAYIRVAVTARSSDRASISGSTAFSRERTTTLSTDVRIRTR